jgi:hypothetical protein
VLELDSRWAGLPADSPLALDKFAPDRWLEGDKVARTGGWLPFGAGARMCLGYSLALAEIKVGGAAGGGMQRGLAMELQRCQCRTAG